MDEQVIDKLVALNQRFYQTFAIKFSETRMRIQPGVKRVVKCLSKGANILDLGCGNGELAHVLAVDGFRGTYLGLDFSSSLIEIARQRLSEFHAFSFIQGDLSNLGWDYQVSEGAGVGRESRKWDIVLAFAALHHIPGRQRHFQICRKVNHLLVHGGLFIHSNWQFLNSDRLRKRIQPWSEIGLDPNDVDPDDYLLDWRLGGRGLRYVHHFHPGELHALAKQTGFGLEDSFFSDGEGGNLGLYQIWRKREDAA